MNLKGMETPIQYPLILIFLPALTLVFSVTPLTGESTCKEVIFKEITKSKCLIDQMKIHKNTSSTEDCALRCILHHKCHYFSYCNGSCYMHRLLYEKEIKKDYDCNCSSYILLSANNKNWQRAFEMTKDSFKRSPIYLYWDKLPIVKVRFRLSRKQDKRIFIFNGTGTNSTSWFQKDKVITILWNGWDPQNLTFNENFSHPYFRIEGPSQTTIEAKREIGNNEKYDISVKSLLRNLSISFETLYITVLFN